MSDVGDSLAPTRARVIKAPSVRRAELLDCAQALFLSKGYDRTTVNDVIAATGLSKGAFYHHFQAKEDLLEAIAARFGEAALADIARLDGEDSGWARLDALSKLNRALAIGREWKIERLAQLRAMFLTMLRPENGLLYRRIVTAVFNALAPILTEIIEQGAREGTFDPADPRIVADALVWLAEGRRPIVVEALAAAEAGEADRAVDIIMRRIRSEEGIVNRILGVPAGSVAFIRSADELRVMLGAWRMQPAS